MCVHVHIDYAKSAHPPPGVTEHWQPLPGDGR